MLTTSGADSDGNFIKMIFLFQCLSLRTYITNNTLRQIINTSKQSTGLFDCFVSSGWIIAAMACGICHNVYKVISLSFLFYIVFNDFVPLLCIFT